MNTTLWESGFNGDGVIIGTADSGIDSDHACFREMINSSANESRKIVFTNISIDDGDKPGHTDYRHGTHVAGTAVGQPPSAEHALEKDRAGWDTNPG